MKGLNGLTVVPHELAREVRDVFEVERAPGRPRRRRWIVVKRRIDRPCALIVGSVVYVHPELMQRLGA